MCSLYRRSVPTFTTCLHFITICRSGIIAQSLYLHVKAITYIKWHFKTIFAKLSRLFRPFFATTTTTTTTTTKSFWVALTGQVYVKA